MRRLIVALLFLGITASSQAEVSLGVNFYMSVTDEGDADVDMLILPSLILTPFSDRVEVVPKLGFAVDVPSGFLHPGGSRGQVDFAMIGGCGFFFRLIETAPLRFSLGPDLTGFIGFGDVPGGDLTIGGFYVSLPVHLDFLLTDRFFIRTGLRTVNLGFHSWEEDRDPLPDRDGTRFEFVVSSINIPSMGFFFTF